MKAHDWASPSGADVLGDEVLGEPEDPSYEASAALLPPVEGYTFLATGEAPEVFAVDPQGRIGFLGTQWGTKPLERVLFDPRDHLPPHSPSARQLQFLGDAGPGIHYTFFDPMAGVRWEEKAFACAGPTLGTSQVLVLLEVGPPGGSRTTQFLRITAAGAEPMGHEEHAAQWSAAARAWGLEFHDAMEVRAPELRVRNASRVSLARAFTTCEGDHPHYGVGHYRDAAHDAFPPTTLSLVNACLEWGLVGRADRFLDHYLDHFVRADGTFDYYGPAVSEYGQMLDLIARYARRRFAPQWLRERLPVIESIAGHLLRLRRESQAKFPEGDVRRGLLWGSPEADTRTEVAHYYAGALWAWRGWTEIGRVFADMGDEAMKERGRELIAECDAYRADIEASLTKCIIPGDPPFVPPAAGFDKPFASMTQDRFASYTNYRYWPEMLSAGFLRPEWADAIIEYRRSHGGELLGTTRFEDRLDDWPYASYAYGLLLRDRVPHYLLGFYGHLVGHCTPGTFTAYEQVSIQGNPRTPVADYCVPAQLVASLMAKWMLVFEEPDADVLWLCRATPRRWLAPGRRIAVERASTRWGMVSFSIDAREDESIHARIRAQRDSLPAEVRLRLRTPAAKPMRHVTVNGAPHTDLDARGEFIRIARPQGRGLDVVASFGE